MKGRTPVSSYMEMTSVNALSPLGTFRRTRKWGLLRYTEWISAPEG